MLHNILECVNVKTIGYDKSSYLKSQHLQLEIDETKREKHTHEVEGWLKLILCNNQYIARFQEESYDIDLALNK
jgi:hypothetical protein